MLYSERNYQGWDSVVLASGQAEIVIPKGIGPRVVHCGIAGKANLFHTVKDELGKCGGSEWHLRGGHRLWHAPEAMPRTYAPDNLPIHIEPSPCGKRVTFTAQQPDPSQLLKSIEIEALGNETYKLTHRITNKGQWAAQFAPWALSVMERGGYATLPLLPKGEHPRDLLPTYHLIPWSYTDLALPQWQFHRDYLGIDTTLASNPQKIGISNYANWVAYWQEGGTFVKAASVNPQATYPDSGSALEIFTNDFMIELETLAPLSIVEPEQTASHVEYWGLLQNLPKPDSEATFTGDYRKAIDAWHQTLKS